MKNLIVSTLLLASSIAAADTSVSGYIRRDGTYVQPHMRSDSDQYRYNNFSSQGNSNRYTGQQGSQRNEYSNPPAYNQGYFNGNGR